MKTTLSVIIYSMFFLYSVTAKSELALTQDIDYISESSYSEGRDLLDIYMPASAEKVPVVVFFHGGALLFGDKTYGKPMAASLVERGFGLVSANYRLSPNHAHPAHVQDAAAATAWVINNIAQYGGDPENVFIAGHSAGAYLAALLAVDPALVEKHTMAKGAVKGAILISPFLYVEETAPQRIATKAVYKSIWGETKEAWLAASVTDFIGPGRDNILVMYADGDDLWRKKQNERFVRDLTSAGNFNVSAIEVKNRTHTTILSNISAEDDQVSELMANFISKLGRTDKGK